MNVLVTGAKGFVGRNLVAALESIPPSSGQIIRYFCITSSAMYSG